MPATGSYVTVFCQPTEAPMGTGFGPLGYYGRESGLAQATQMACRLLAWSTRVRVQGERLFQRLPDGQLQFAGESFELLEVPEVTPDSCHLDTVEAGPFVWVIAAPPGVDVPAGAAGFPAERPAWITNPPSTPGWLYAAGTAKLSYRNEPGRWEEATYAALVELALSVGSRAGGMELEAADVARGAHVVSVDTVLEGFEVAGRWRDREHAYVLGRVPVSGAVSYLSTGPAQRPAPPPP
ncbi:MAG: hypothetical protein AB1505_20115 [Candidatus Latescibacterota bacterium]